MDAVKGREEGEPYSQLSNWERKGSWEKRTWHVRATTDPTADDGASGCLVGWGSHASPILNLGGWVAGRVMSPQFGQRKVTGPGRPVGLSG